MLTQIQIHKVSYNLEFMTKFGKALEGKVIEAQVTINQWQKIIVYELELETGQEF